MGTPDGGNGLPRVMTLRPQIRSGRLRPPQAPAVPAADNSSPTPNPAEARITLTLNEIPFGEALRYIASQAGLKVKVEPYAVSIIPVSEQSNDLFTKEYRVPPGFISTSVNVGASALRHALRFPPRRGSTCNRPEQARILSKHWWQTTR